VLTALNPVTPIGLKKKKERNRPELTTEPLKQKGCPPEPVPEEQGRALSLGSCLSLEFVSTLQVMKVKTPVTRVPSPQETVPRMYEGLETVISAHHKVAGSVSCQHWHSPRGGKAGERTGVPRATAAPLLRASHAPPACQPWDVAYGHSDCMAVAVCAWGQRICSAVSSPSPMLSSQLGDKAPLCQLEL
jgi:hypothetical protein